jgi:hypothetical protein
VWLNSLDRVLESARKCRSLDELLHGGILEQGRKAKGLAGDLFYLPVALVAFTRFGYLMRRTFFRLMLGDLNQILEGLTDLEDKGVTTIDCRRAQFSEREPIVRLRMICQSWKVMFQAEYSSGSPLRMLVDLRASVDQALGRGKASEPAKAKAEPGPTEPGPTKPGPTKPGSTKPGPTEKSAEKSPEKPSAKPPVRAAVGAKTSSVTAKPVASAAAAGASKPSRSRAPEFEVSSTPGWDSDSDSQPDKKN